MVGWHHQLKGHECEQTLRDSERLAWRAAVHRVSELDMNVQLNNNNRLMHLPIHRKALNSLTWAVWFSLIHRILLMFRLPPFRCQLLFNLASSLTPWSSSLEGHLDAVSRA